MLTTVVAIAMLLQPVKTMPLNPKAACSHASNKAYCEEVLLMADSVDPHASMHHLHELIAKNGWPSPSSVGKEASSIALHVIERGTTEAGEHHSRPGVARMWHGRVPNARADEYQEYLDHDGVHKLLSIKDNLGVQMFRRDLGDGTTEFVVISYWPNRDAIHAYAGADIEKTHFLPRDKDFLIDPDPNVRHYDIMLDRSARDK